MTFLKTLPDFTKNYISKKTSKFQKNSQNTTRFHETGGPEFQNTITFSENMSWNTTFHKRTTRFHKKKKKLQTSTKKFPKDNKFRKTQHFTKNNTFNKKLQHFTNH